MLALAGQLHLHFSEVLMHLITKTMCACALAGAIAIPSARADNQSSDPEPSAKSGMKAQLTKHTNKMATVDKIDTDNRMLTLKMDDGTTKDVHVPEAVQLSDIKQGDHIKFDYFESTALSWRRSGPGAGSGESTIVGKAGNTAMIGKTVKESVEITKIDKAHNKVTVKMPSGETETIEVKDPELIADLQKAHEGDKLDATFTRSELISLQKASK
jgi:hypothetical protein